MENLLYFSVLLMAGFITGKFVNILKLPSVTGYLLSGIIIGPYGFNIIPFNFIESMDFLKSVALAFIAFSIGSEFETTVLKKLGKSVFIVTIIQALAASLMVIIVMFFIFDQSLSLSLLLGAIAAATAPAATVMVIKQYEAKGPLTQTLLSVVALDDAVCVILFGVMLTIIKSLSSTGSEGNITLMLLHPFLEIIGSFALGMGASILTIILLKLTRSREEITVIGSAIVIGVSVLAEKLGFSLLLTSMVLGGILANTTPNIRKIFSATSNITPPIYVAFFTFAGLTLEIGLLSKVGLIGIGYIFARAMGKILGCVIGGRLSKSPEVVTKYLGLGMLPQAGVAIGLSMVAKQQFPKIGNTISTVVLTGVVVYELIGPILAKIAIQRAGEITSNPLHPL